MLRSAVPALALVVLAGGCTLQPDSWSVIKREAAWTDTRPHPVGHRLTLSVEPSGADLLVKQAAKGWCMPTDFGHEELVEQGELRVGPGPYLAAAAILGTSIGAIPLIDAEDETLNIVGYVMLGLSIGALIPLIAEGWSDRGTVRRTRRGVPRSQVLWSGPRYQRFRSWDQPCARQPSKINYAQPVTVRLGFGQLHVIKRFGEQDGWATVLPASWERPPDPRTGVARFEGLWQRARWAAAGCPGSPVWVRVSARLDSKRPATASDPAMWAEWDGPAVLFQEVLPSPPPRDAQSPPTLQSLVRRCVSRMTAMCEKQERDIVACASECQGSGAEADACRASCRKQIGLDVCGHYGTGTR